MAQPFGVMSGARAKLGFLDPRTGKPVYIGIYTDVSYTYDIDVQPAYILGRYSAASLDNVAMNTVHVTCNGWRVVDHGPMAEGNFPRLDELAQAGYLSIAIEDRQSGKTIAIIEKVRPMSFSGGFSLRTLAQINMTYVGILLSDETAETNYEDATAMELPQD